jgi:hypothetical protein
MQGSVRIQGKYTGPQPDFEKALLELAAAARWVDRSAFGKEEGFGQAHQALLKALDKAKPIRVEAGPCEKRTEAPADSMGANLPW